MKLEVEQIDMEREEDVSAKSSLFRCSKSMILNADKIHTSIAFGKIRGCAVKRGGSYRFTKICRGFKAAARNLGGDGE